MRGKTVLVLLAVLVLSGLAISNVPVTTATPNNPPQTIQSDVLSQANNTTIEPSIWIFSVEEFALGEGSNLIGIVDKPKTGIWSLLRAEQKIISKANTSGTIWYGPYSTLPSGTYNVYYLVRVEQSTEPVLTLDIAGENNTRIAGKQVSETDGWEWKVLRFTVSQPQEQVEFRGFRDSAGTVKFAGVVVVKTDEIPTNASI